jgi:hypothetical protein
MRGDASADRPQLHSSLTLLEQAQAGDHAALESLIARYLPRLQCWATGRLVKWLLRLDSNQQPSG